MRRRLFGRIPPLMERSPWDDLRWACAVLLGSALGVLVFAPSRPEDLVWRAVGAVLVIAVMTVVRRVARRRTRGAPTQQ
jgi:hypothetical protein